MWNYISGIPVKQGSVWPARSFCELRPASFLGQAKNEEADLS